MFGFLRWAFDRKVERLNENSARATETGKIVVIDGKKQYTTDVPAACTITAMDGGICKITRDDYRAITSTAPSKWEVKTPSFATHDCGV